MHNGCASKQLHVRTSQATDAAGPRLAHPETDMNENLSLGRIFGIHVGLNWSLLVVAALIAWSLATSILPSAAPGQTSEAYWIAGVLSAFVFLASLLAH